MNISVGLLSGNWLWVFYPIYLAAFIYAGFKAPWKILLSTRGLQHLFFAATVVLMLMWSMRAGISPGLSIHFLGMTVLTLLLGWDLAILSGSLVLIAMTLIGKESWEGIAVNGICLILIPAALSFFIHRYVDRNFPKNFFIYLFLTGFLGAACVVAVSGLSMSAVLWLDGVYEWKKIYHEYVRYLPLIMFPEALMSGIILTGIMVFHPDWIRTFDARVFIDEQ